MKRRLDCVDSVLGREGTQPYSSLSTFQEDLEALQTLHIPLTKHEMQRIQILRETNILGDKGVEESLDRFTTLAQRYFHVPFALLNLVDTKWIFLKSKVGMDIEAVPRDVAFCAYTILAPNQMVEVLEERREEAVDQCWTARYLLPTDDLPAPSTDNRDPSIVEEQPIKPTDHIFVIPDTHKNALFRENLLVTGPPFIRFYAGAAIVVNGHRVGTFCILDTKPHALLPTNHDYSNPMESKFSEQNLRLLRDLATVVSSRMMQRRAMLQSVNINRAFYLLSVAYHVINPLLQCNQQCKQLEMCAKQVTKESVEEVRRSLQVFRNSMLSLQLSIELSIDLVLHAMKAMSSFAHTQHQFQGSQSRGFPWRDYLQHLEHQANKPEALQSNWQALPPHLLQVKSSVAYDILQEFQWYDLETVQSSEKKEVLLNVARDSPLLTLLTHICHRVDPLVASPSSSEQCTEVIEIAYALLHSPKNAILTSKLASEVPGQLYLEIRKVVPLHFTTPASAPIDEHVMVMETEVDGESKDNSLDKMKAPLAPTENEEENMRWIRKTKNMCDRFVYDHVLKTVSGTMDMQIEEQTLSNGQHVEVIHYYIWHPLVLIEMDTDCMEEDLTQSMSTSSNITNIVEPQAHSLQCSSLDEAVHFNVKVNPGYRPVKDSKENQVLPIE